MSDLPHSDHGDDARRAVSLGPGLPEIPERLLLAHARGEVLFICGAGISRPAGLPDFRKLVLDVYETLDSSVYEILPKIPNGALDTTEPSWSKLINNQKAEVKRFIAGEYDVVLGMLERRLDDQTHEKSKSTSKVRGTVAELLRQASDKPAQIHRALMRLADRGGATTIMTTNFDLLLEAAAKRLRSPLETYALGSIPRPTTRTEFAGVLHVHGALDRNPARFSDLVLSDQDLGEYYLRRRIVPDLIYDAARLFHLVLVGYSANDPPMRYLLNAVAADGARFSDLKERFTFVGSCDPVELEDWKARGITPIPYEAPHGDHGLLRDALERWAELSAINGKTRTVDVEVRRIVRKSRAVASEADRNLFDHLFRRGHANDRIRLAGVASAAKAEPGWLDSIIQTRSGKLSETAIVTGSWARLTEADRHQVRVMTAFLKNRLTEPAVIDWALNSEYNENVKRIAIDDLLNGHGSPTVVEPHATAWRLIEESGCNRPAEDHPAITFVTIRDRLSNGDRSGALISAIVDLFAPRLEVKAIEERPCWPFKRPRHPKTFEDLLSANLTSVHLGQLDDYGDLHIGKVSEVPFLKELADALASAVQRGLNIVNRIYRTDESGGVPWESPHRVDFVRLPEISKDVGGAFGHDGDEPDLFNDGIAPSVKLLHEVVLRIAELNLEAATPFFRSWRFSGSGVHRRLWAAIARDAQFATPEDVGDFLTTLSDHELWNLDEFPEVTELRAKRVQELRRDVQETIVQRLCKGRPRKLYDRAAPAEKVKAHRRYCAAREVKRVEVAGGTLPYQTRRWLLRELTKFPELTHMPLDHDFPDPSPHPVPRPSPDEAYDMLEGEARLLELERVLLHGQTHWTEDTAGRAKAWLQKSENVPLILSDFESLSGTADHFPQVWSSFLRWHEPPPPTPTDEWPRRLPNETERVLHLLSALPEAHLSEAIWGVSHWLWHWRRYVMLSERGFPVWLRAWPIAVEATNAAVEKAGDHAPPHRRDTVPVDVDGLNLPSGKLVEVFLASCPSPKENPVPYADDSLTKQMRDLVIAQSGHSGLIARCQLVGRLPDFLRADPDWTKEHLIEPLLKDDSSAMWSKIARCRYAKYLLETISDTVLKRCTDHRLGREARKLLVSDLVTEALDAFREGREPRVPNPHILQMLRSADDETREFAAQAVRSFYTEASPVAGRPQSTDVLFREAVAKFLREVWPKDRSLKTPEVSRKLSGIPAASSGAFVEAVDVIKDLLMPFDGRNMGDYGLDGEVETEGEVVSRLSLTVSNKRKAAALLALLDSTIGAKQETRAPFGLSDALDRIKTLAPDLADRPAFRRLSTAARRQG